MANKIESKKGVIPPPLPASCYKPNPDSTKYSNSLVEISRTNIGDINGDGRDDFVVTEADKNFISTNLCAPTPHFYTYTAVRFGSSDATKLLGANIVTGKQIGRAHV